MKSTVLASSIAIAASQQAGTLQEEKHPADVLQIYHQHETLCLAAVYGHADLCDCDNPEEGGANCGLWGQHRGGNAWNIAGDMMKTKGTLNISGTDTVVEQCLVVLENWLIPWPVDTADFRTDGGGCVTTTLDADNIWWIGSTCAVRGANYIWLTTDRASCSTDWRRLPVLSTVYAMV